MSIGSTIQFLQNILYIDNSTDIPVRRIKQIIIAS